MIKTSKKLIAKLLLVTTCISVMPTTFAFAEENGGSQSTGTSVIQTTSSAVSISNKSDEKTTEAAVSVTDASEFEFDSTTGTITGYTGTDGDVIIPSEINGVKVTSIGENAFERKTNLTSVIIPSSVTSIGNWAFGDCTNLTSVTLSNGITDIGENAFYECGELVNINIPNSVVSIHDGAFYCCAFTNIIIPSSVTNIEEGAFASCASLKNIDVSKDNNNYTSVDGVLYNKLKTSIVAYPDGREESSYTIPSSVTSIGTAFEFSKLTSITIPGNIQDIETCAFAYCCNLQNVIISDGVASIGEQAFNCCFNLTSVVIPDSIGCIGERSFICDSPNIKFYVDSEGTKQQLIYSMNNYYYGDDDSIEAHIIVNGQSETVKVTSITLNNTSLNLEKGITSTLTATVSPDNATDKAVMWCSSDYDVATVDENGKVTGVGVGSATITCISSEGNELGPIAIAGNPSATCLVTVTNPTAKISSIKLSVLDGGDQTFTLVPTISPSNAGNKILTWTSSNTKVAIVDNNGNVTCIGKGDAMITCTATDGSKVSKSFYVKNDYYTNPTVKISSIKLNVLDGGGKTVTLVPTIYPSNAGNKTLTWTSSNTKVAIVDNKGNVTYVGKGDAMITCTATDGSKVSKSFYVKNDYYTSQTK